MIRDAYAQSQRAELRSRLRLARAAVRVPEPRPWAMAVIRSDADARRVIGRLYPSPYSREELDALDNA